MERTCAILKPDCVRKQLTGKVLNMALDKGFHLLGLKMVKLTRAQVEAFYEEHRGKPFYEKLVDFMTEGRVIVAVLEKENAINDWRALMGKTDPKEAAEGTIRRLYAETVSINVVHGSDCAESAAREIAFFFSKSELL